MKDTLRRMYLVPGCLALGWLLFGASALRGDLLLNGSFESPEVVSDYGWDFFSPGQTIGAGWVVSRGVSIVYDVRSSGTPLPLDGVQALLLGDVVYQDVVLPASTSFSLAFQMASEQGTPSLVHIDVLRDGASILQTPQGFQQPEGAPFEPFALEFQSSLAGAYRILVDGGVGRGAYVDAFTLNAVPEPETAVLWSLMGLVTMAWSCRARRNRMPPRPW